MTQGERVNAVRKELKLTLEKFGEKLGVGKTAISKIEKNERNLTPQMAKAICREFNVNEEWLREGAGEMFIEMSVEDEIDAFCGKIKGLSQDDPIRKIMMMMAKLPEEDWKAVQHMIDLLTKGE